MIDFTSTRYTLHEIIGEGNFGSVYKAFDHTTNENVAIKFEKSPKSRQIEVEIEVLQSVGDCTGFSRLIDYGKLENGCSFMVMQLLGKDLQTKYYRYQKRISAEKILKIGVQCLKRIKSLHENLFIHRDIKPQQFLINAKNEIFLIDFGLSKRYMSKKLMIHIPFSDNKRFVGTANYASLYTHQGIQQSRRDDLESFCYTLSYLMNRGLP